ncbi:hypothetical protein EsDP_00000930 [Epichloe bromicola]|uniref:Uncharacterized protein n=1 Tax=Epichloe bromicola TaxID=79588 RepID=A0ABQ0CGF5_9HYPO
MDASTSSQTSTHFPLSPLPASVLAAREVERRNAVRQLGPCRSGCGELDDHVLLSGGFERGCVLGLQVLSRELLDSPSGKALLVTPRPAAEALRSLRDSLGAQMPAGDVKACLDRVMLSCVFDMDGLWEVLSDLDQVRGGDGQEEEEEPEPEPGSRSPPSIILITHFSALLAALFTQRAREAAHGALALLAAHLRHLSRSLASHPLVVILNSVAGAQQQQQQQQHKKRHGKKAGLDRSLQSIFDSPPLHIPGYKASSGALRRAKKPSFGLVFTQLLDLHLLCSRVARTRDDAEMSVAAGEREGEGDGDGDGDGNRRARFVTVVEVLMDDMGLWQGKRGPRPSREQRWTAVDVVSGRIRCAM